MTAHAADILEMPQPHANQLSSLISLQASHYSKCYWMIKEAGLINSSVLHSRTTVREIPWYAGGWCFAGNDYRMEGICHQIIIWDGQNDGQMDGFIQQQ